MDKSLEVYHCKDYLTDLGCGYGFRIRDDCNINTNSWSRLGSGGRYELPQGIKPGTNEARSYLAGSLNFKILEMEVFKLEWKK